MLEGKKKNRIKKECKKLVSNLKSFKNLHGNAGQITIFWWSDSFKSYCNEAEEIKEGVEGIKVQQ